MRSTPLLQLGSYYRYNLQGSDRFDTSTARPKPVIFVAVRDLSIIVSGKTRQRCKALGFEGMHFKWDRDRQHWYGSLSLRNLEGLDRWPEAVAVLQMPRNPTLRQGNWGIQAENNIFF